jgi:hypothetical protein
MTVAQYFRYKGDSWQSDLLVVNSSVFGLLNSSSASPWNSVRFRICQKYK